MDLNVSKMVIAVYPSSCPLLRGLILPKKYIWIWFLIGSTFADKHLDGLNDNQLDQYDKLINEPSNDWEIYYWMTDKKPTPTEYDNPVMELLKIHAKNENMEERIRQPDLQAK